MSRYREVAFEYGPLTFESMVILVGRDGIEPSTNWLKAF